MPTAFVSTIRCRIGNRLIHTESLILELRVLLLTTARIPGSDEKKKKKKHAFQIIHNLQKLWFQRISANEHRTKFVSYTPIKTLESENSSVHS